MHDVIAKKITFYFFYVDEQHIIFYLYCIKTSVTAFYMDNFIKTSIKVICTVLGEIVWLIFVRGFFLQLKWCSFCLRNF